MKSIINGQLYLNGKFQKDKVIVFKERITHIYTVEDYETYKKDNKITEEIDAKNQFVVPGFIDVHIHGYEGIDVMDGNISSLVKLSEGILENGVTAYLPTTMTMDLEKIKAALDSIESVMRNGNEMNRKGAMIIGAHLEGPFINKDYKGAQPEDFIIEPEISLIEDYEHVIKVVTIAPEIRGALPMITRFKDSMNFSIGHSGASYEEAVEAFEAGAKSVTHLFNAMTGLHHRKPGIVGAALTCDCYCEVIADKFHIHENLFQLVVRSKGLDRILLITDCMQAGGLSDGKYELGGLEVTVNNNQCRLNDGTIAGSVLKLNEGLYNFSESIVENLENVIPLVTSNQASYLNVEEDMGTLEVNKLANIVLINSKIEVSKTIVKGKVVYENQL